MTVVPSSSVRHDPTRLAAAARSILSCPAGVHLAVDGVPGVLEGEEAAGTGMRDCGGEPTFSTPLGSELAVAAADGLRALLTLHSGLGPRGSADRTATLALAGRLVVRGREVCECCGDPREVVALEPDLVALGRTTRAGIPAEQPVHVDVAAFRAPEHQLNRGYLQRSVEHANSHHQDELRRAVSTATGAPMDDVVGVGLADLRTDRVEVQWVGPHGADRTVLHFPRAARTTAELGDLLRRQLHHGMC
ncbi:hypothetical protein [Nocardioides marmotae]|uniref:DUF2470 domain-containing protein n=1 Tax=Nocardioides marmotae TaxID=2663857 RepID=A0A6I3JGH6_9ACTN|nr:hypothetical protein [Nocardioides marmotae]MCR6033571.1 hypothetical protein [Gordonia jinghuaiqii]MBC9735525.1 hypothetical protein [Nocardioides marmotae]MTB86622.1 hypothetical protein [Nocardioides marmotae]MTB97229.1 hypothetical protein [Nocardioides marmotae]QKE02144.1 hypothetical protein HPC71_14470 [Nocardioides marmotae]